MLIKNEVLKSIEELPEEFSFDDVLDRLLLLDKIETGLEQSHSGQTFTADEAKEQLSKWLK
jgi:predicted transcriptional regulator